MKKLLALLMAAVMLVTLCSGGNETEDDALTPIDPTEATRLVEAFIEAYYLRDYATQFSLCFYDARGQWEDKVIADNGTAEAFFAIAQRQADEKGIEVVVDSFDSYYAAYHRFILEDCRSIYGEYTLTVTTTANVKMAADLLPEFRSNLLSGPAKDYMDAAALEAIDEVYTVTVNLVIDGEKKDHSEHYLVYAVNHQGQWLVADYSA